MLHTLKNETLTLEVSDIGGEPRSLVKNATGREYLFKADPAWWDNTSPCLFPVTGRFHNVKYTLDGKEYELIIHGFVRRNPMECIEATDTKIVHRRVSDDVTRAVYPFEFDFRISHELIGSSVKVTFCVENTGDVTMPFQFGAHPAFVSKLGNEIHLMGNKGSYSFKNLEAKLLPEESVPCNDRITITADTFKKDALFFTEKQLYAARLADENGEYIEVSFTGFPNCVFWSPVGAPFCCIEPWFGCDDKVGTDDDFRSRYCMNFLAPHNRFELSYYINVL